MIKKLKDEFLEKNKYYINDINNFIDYLDFKEGNGTLCKEFTIRGMTTEVILNSLQHYIDKGQIKKKSVAKKYTSTVGQLFEFIFENSDIQNISLKNELGAPSTRKKSYTGQCMKFINKNEKLLDIEPNEALDESSVNILINWCNNRISKMDKGAELLTETEFSQIAASLCLKLTLLTGITYRDSRMLKFNYLDTDLNTILINNYKIRLPLVLSGQFKQYRNICNDKLFNVCDGFLFIDFKGEQWGEKTTMSNIPTYLKTVTGATSITSVIKYGIKQLMLQDVNDSVILKLTGASTSILNGCISGKDGEELDWYTYINSKILKTTLYKSL